MSDLTQDERHAIATEAAKPLFHRDFEAARAQRLLDSFTASVESSDPFVHHPDGYVELAQQNARRIEASSSMSGGPWVSPAKAQISTLVSPGLVISGAVSRIITTPEKCEAILALLIGLSDNTRCVELFRSSAEDAQRGVQYDYEDMTVALVPIVEGLTFEALVDDLYDRLLTVRGRSFR